MELCDRRAEGRIECNPADVTQTLCRTVAGDPLDGTELTCSGGRDEDCYAFL